MLTETRFACPRIERTFGIETATKTPRVTVMMSSRRRNSNVTGIPIRLNLLGDLIIVCVLCVGLYGILGVCYVARVADVVGGLL